MFGQWLRRRHRWKPAVGLVGASLLFLMVDLAGGLSHSRLPWFPDQQPDPRLTCHLFDPSRQVVLIATMQHEQGVFTPDVIRQFIDRPCLVRPVRSRPLDKAISDQLHNPELAMYRLLNSVRLDVSDDPDLIACLQAMAQSADMYDAKLFLAAFVTQGAEAGRCREVSLETMHILADRYGVPRGKVNQDWVYQSVRLHGPSSSLLDQVKDRPPLLAAYADACSLVPVSQADREALFNAVLATPELEDDLAAAACLLAVDHPRRQAHLDALIERFTYRTLFGFKGRMMRTGSSMDTRLFHRIREMEPLAALSDEGMRALTVGEVSWFDVPSMRGSWLECSYKAWLLHRHGQALIGQWTYRRNAQAMGSSLPTDRLAVDKQLRMYRQRAEPASAKPLPGA